jgi:hypothetical protein
VAASSTGAYCERAVSRFTEHVHAFGREFVLTASPDHDAELVRYFHRWTQRQQFLIEGTGAHHEPLIHISPQPLTEWE